MSFTPSSIAHTCSTSTASPRAREMRQCHGLAHREKSLWWCPSGAMDGETGWGLVWPCSGGTLDAGPSVSAGRAGGTCFVIAVHMVVGIGEVVGARVDSARSGLVTEILGSTTGDGEIIDILGSVDGNEEIMEVLGSPVDDEMVMEILGSTDGDGAVMEVLGSTAGDGVVVEILDSVVGDGVVIEISGSTDGDGVVMEALYSDGAVVEILSSMVDGDMVMEAFESMVGEGAVMKLSVGVAGNMKEVATGNGMVGSAIMGKATDDSIACAAVGTSSVGSKGGIPCDDVEVRSRDGMKETEGGRVAGQISWFSLSDITACPAR